MKSPKVKAPKIVETTGTEDHRFFDVIWVEANRRDELIMRRKEFTTYKGQQRFVAQIEKKDNFIRLEAVYSY